MKPFPLACSIPVLLALTLLGWNSATPDRQLQSVASQWSKTIRASQVIPVYPMTEDLQPGDVFVVQVPIARQHEVWEQEGYLPLDQAGFRLTGLEFQDCYADMYLNKGWTNPAQQQPPYDRPTPVIPTTGPAAADPIPAAELELQWRRDTLLLLGRFAGTVT